MFLAVLRFLLDFFRWVLIPTRSIAVCTTHGDRLKQEGSALSLYVQAEEIIECYWCKDQDRATSTMSGRGKGGRGGGGGDTKSQKNSRGGGVGKSQANSNNNASGGGGFGDGGSGFGFGNNQGFGDGANNSPGGGFGSSAGGFGNNIGTNVFSYDNIDASSDHHSDSNHDESQVNDCGGGTGGTNVGDGFASSGGFGGFNANAHRKLSSSGSHKSVRSDKSKSDTGGFSNTGFGVTTGNDGFGASQNDGAGAGFGNTGFGGGNRKSSTASASSEKKHGFGALQNDSGGGFGFSSNKDKESTGFNESNLVKSNNDGFGSVDFIAVSESTVKSRSRRQSTVSHMSTVFESKGERTNSGDGGFGGSSSGFGFANQGFGGNTNDSSGGGIGTATNVFSYDNNDAASDRHSDDHHDDESQANNWGGGNGRSNAGFQSGDGFGSSANNGGGFSGFGVTSEQKPSPATSHKSDRSAKSKNSDAGGFSNAGFGVTTGSGGFGESQNNGGGGGEFSNTGFGGGDRKRITSGKNQGFGTPENDDGGFGFSASNDKKSSGFNDSSSVKSNGDSFGNIGFGAGSESTVKNRSRRPSTASHMSTVFESKGEQTNGGDGEFGGGESGFGSANHGFGGVANNSSGGGFGAATGDFNNIATNVFSYDNNDAAFDHPSDDNHDEESQANEWGGGISGTNTGFQSGGGFGSSAKNGGGFGGFGANIDRKPSSAASHANDRTDKSKREAGGFSNGGFGVSSGSGGFSQSQNSAGVGGFGNSGFGGANRKSSTTTEKSVGRFDSSSNNGGFGGFGAKTAAASHKNDRPDKSKSGAGGSTNIGFRVSTGVQKIHDRDGILYSPETSSSAKEQSMSSHPSSSYSGIPPSECPPSTDTWLRQRHQPGFVRRAAALYAENTGGNTSIVANRHRQAEKIQDVVRSCVEIREELQQPRITSSKQRTPIPPVMMQVSESASKSNNRGVGVSGSYSALRNEPMRNDAYTMSEYRQKATEHRRRAYGSSDSPLDSPSESPISEGMTSYHNKKPQRTEQPRAVLAGKKAASSSRTATLDQNYRATSTPQEGESLNSTCLNLFEPEEMGYVSMDATQYGQMHDFQRQIKRLSDALLVQETQLIQAHAAVSFTQKKPGYEGSEEQLSGHRALLLARERHLAIQRQIQRLKTLHMVDQPIPASLLRPVDGSVFEIRSIVVELNRNFCARLPNDRDSYAFLVLARCSESVKATQIATFWVDEHNKKEIAFDDRLVLSHLADDFIVTLEVFAMKIREAGRKHDDFIRKNANSLKDRAKAFLSPPDALNRKHHDGDTDSNASAVGFSEFVKCGTVRLNQATTGRQRFYLDRALYPLEGTIELKASSANLQLERECQSVQFEGFLTIYQVIDDYGTWSRMWAVLERGVVKFWKYPNDAVAEKPAKAVMFMAKCLDDQINSAPRSLTARPNTFICHFLAPSSQSPNAMEKRRVLLSADTPELCEIWIKHLNRALKWMRRQ